jgi:hypothetical protein
MKRAIAAALAAILAACSSPQANPTGPSPNLPQLKTARSANLVYVSSQSTGEGEVNIYSSKGQAQAPIGVITDGISGPQALAVDAGGNLYVANSGNSTVTVYVPDSMTPSITYTSGVNTPFGVAVGTDGTVYVANAAGGPSGGGSVTEFPKGSTTPSTTLETSGESAFAVALDAQNHLYVSWFGFSTYQVAVYEYPTEGSGTGENLNLDLPSNSFPAYVLAFDPAGNLIVPCEPLTHNPPKYLAVFAPGATHPKRKINLAGMLDIVTGIVFVPGRKKLFYASAENDHDWLTLTFPKLIPRDVVNVGVPTGLAVAP